jgi:integrase
MNVSNELRPLRRRPVLRLAEAPSAESVSDYLLAWLRSRRSLRESTVRSYEGHIRRYIVPAIGHLVLTELSTEHIDAMYERLLHPDGAKRRLSTSTIVRIHATLMSALNAAVRSGRLSHNPAVHIELPAPRRLEQKVWTASELMSFLDVHIDDEMHALFALLGLRGLRRGEALGLRWSDVDLRSLELRVVQQLTVDHGVPSFGPPKSRAGDRIVAIDEWMAQILHFRRSQQRLAGKLNGWEAEDHTLVFTDAQGGYLSPIAVTRRFDRLVAETDLPRIRLHDLRHTSASIGLASGESLLEVSRRLGHSSVAVTGDIYTHVSSEAAQAAADRMSRYMIARR